MTCPAGKQRNDDRTDCDECSPGSYNSTPGGTCKKCPAGQFNNVSGAESCCDCCAGFHSTTSRTSCSRCEDYNQYAPRKKYSAVRSNSSGDCKLVQGTLPTPPATCTQPANNACPTTTPGGLQGLSTPFKKRSDQCGSDSDCDQGSKCCPKQDGRGDLICVDSNTDPNFCGGCVGLGGSGSGENCTLSKKRCVNGICVGGETKMRRSSAKHAVRHKIY
ncbi:hypothetical protein M407DRAFT_22556 [Tulasnella calospora MUT 4182]|uniref:WAP domain-containing protein n=1 Tax=Tulasnella calospora MUT 4182 TaxID=1051891 RepID=A0A0C3L3A8_9AGAM|nr:hypothetical protein M407DRAFT_22556 [Tulasnella calospora MUT 4182]